jgi:hypothetical protein
MKKAVSLPDDVFAEAEALARAHLQIGEGTACFSWQGNPRDIGDVGIRCGKPV